MANSTQYKLTIAQLRAMKFNNGAEDFMVIKRYGNTVCIRPVNNYCGGMQSETIGNLFDTRYYSINDN